MEREEALRQIVNFRAEELEPEIRRRLLEARDVVVFGSFASGVETESSDLDLFGIGDASLHYKTKQLEILLLPDFKAHSEVWLGSELANHIKHYGVPLAETPDWFFKAELTQAEWHRKQRRIASYMKSLAAHWDKLSPNAQGRYRVKVRRELQRAILLKAKLPTPPTKFLDEEFEGMTGKQKATLFREAAGLQSHFLEIFYPPSIDMITPL